MSVVAGPRRLSTHTGAALLDGLAGVELADTAPDIAQVVRASVRPFRGVTSSSSSSVPEPTVASCGESPAATDTNRGHGRGLGSGDGCTALEARRPGRDRGRRSGGPPDDPVGGWAVVELNTLTRRLRPSAVERVDLAFTGVLLTLAVIGFRATFAGHEELYVGIPAVLLGLAAGYLIVKLRLDLLTATAGLLVVFVAFAPPGYPKRRVPLGPPHPGRLHRPVERPRLRLGQAADHRAARRRGRDTPRPLRRRVLLRGGYTRRPTPPDVARVCRRTHRGTRGRRALRTHRPVSLLLQGDLFGAITIGWLSVREARRRSLTTNIPWRQRLLASGGTLAAGGALHPPRPGPPRRRRRASLRAPETHRAAVRPAHAAQPPRRLPPVHRGGPRGHPHPASRGSPAWCPGAVGSARRLRRAGLARHRPWHGACRSLRPHRRGDPGSEPGPCGGHRCPGPAPARGLAPHRRRCRLLRVRRRR